MTEEARLAGIVQQSRDLKSELGCVAAKFARTSPFHGAAIILQLIAIAHELAMIVANGDKSIALDMLVSAVNGTQDSSETLFKLANQKTERKKPNE